MSITYLELKEWVNGLSDEQLDMEVFVEDGSGEFRVVDGKYVLFDDNGVLDANQPILSMYQAI
jgi:hypothetical protein